MRVTVAIAETDLESEDGYSVEGVVATCSRCNHQTESFGTGDASITRCCVLMREGCPRSEHNFYRERE